MTTSIPDGHPLRRLFLKLTESSMTSLGIGDEELIVYVSDLLVRFVRTDQLYKIKNAAGDRLIYLVDMLLATTDAPAKHQRREIRQHIGDYCLFLLGLFPESLRRPRRPVHTAFYVRQGRDSYRAVAEMDWHKPTAPLFRRLSDRFESCIEALSLEREYLQDPACQYISRQMGW